MARKRAPQLVGMAELAAALGLSRMRVSQLAGDGVIPKVARGKYDLVECLKAMMAYYRRAAQSRGSELEQAKLREQIANAERAERANLVEAGKFVPAEAAEVIWSMAMAEVKDGIEANPIFTEEHKAAMTTIVQGIKLDALAPEV